ncbi:MAG: hypothetical protein M1829_002141 [Trizodia sp. TS-e1964]|nr:MAG: hypothetical protein M1829_002141 [Trizodia sp. TS-e1964]
MLKEIISSSGEMAESSSERDTALKKDINIEIDFGPMSLKEFIEPSQEQDVGELVERYNFTSQAINEYDKENEKFEDLHASILACDEVLKSVENYLTSFQTDLGAVSVEIETLQLRSIALSTKLENRKAVEGLLGPAVESLSIAPACVKKISEGPIDEGWISALQDLGSRLEAVKGTPHGHIDLKLLHDVKPLLENLKNKIKALRSPNVNAQIIQKQCLLKYKQLYAFISAHHSRLAGEIGQAFINTMKWYYLSNFTRYQKVLEKMKLASNDKNNLLSQDETSRRNTTLNAPKGTISHDTFSLGRRADFLRSPNQLALLTYIVEEDKSIHHIEVPFRSFNQALIDNACSEYSFLTEFFSSCPIHQIAHKFNEIFESTFALGRTFTKTLIDSSTDSLGILICVRLNQRLAFELQRHKVPTVDPYINATSMLLWPRFQIVMDMHCDSLRRTIASPPIKGATLPFTAESSNQSTAPHFLTQRFGQFLNSILALSVEAGDDEPVASSLVRLQTDFEVLLTKMSRGLMDSTKRERFLFNNYSLISTIISDSKGSLAIEQKEHFEALKLAFGEEP